MKNKIIQILVATENSSNYRTLFALDSEGNIYQLNLHRDGEVCNKVRTSIEQARD